MPKEKITSAEAFIATSNITNALGRMVKRQSAAPFYAPASAGTDVPGGIIYVPGKSRGAGVTQFTATIATGDDVHIATAGVVQVKLGANLAAGANVTANASGVAVAPTSGDYVWGQLMEGGSSGDYVPMMINVFKI